MLIIVEPVYRLPQRVEVQGSENNGVGVLIGGKSVKIDAGTVNYGAPGQDGSGADPVFINNTEQRLTDLEEATDGIHLGVEPLQYYILARDN